MSCCAAAMSRGPGAVSSMITAACCSASSVALPATPTRAWICSRTSASSFVRMACPGCGAFATTPRSRQRFQPGSSSSPAASSSIGIANATAGSAAPPPRDLSPLGAAIYGQGLRGRQVASRYLRMGPHAYRSVAFPPGVPPRTANGPQGDVPRTRLGARRAQCSTSPRSIRHRAPRTSWSNEEASASLGTAMATLAPDVRTAVQLLVQEGMTASDVARVLGWPNAKSVYNRVYRALATLRASLADEDSRPDRCSTAFGPLLSNPAPPSVSCQHTWATRDGRLTTMTLDPCPDRSDLLQLVHRAGAPDRNLSRVERHVACCDQCQER